MITSSGVGVGVGVGGVGGGAGMLRARRRDVSIKPNRKLDRKSSRGMIYENEELRLRTIHINAEVEQGQNDIKKLRRENEQLRREIWCLREEYDKLEEILKSQKSREAEELENSETDEDFSDSDCSSGSNEEGSEFTDEEDVEKKKEKKNEEDEKTARESENDDYKKTLEKLKKECPPIRDELLENAENQKLSGEKMNNIHRLHVEFDQLSTVVEEEETKKDKANRKKDERELIRGPESSEINEIEVKGKINKNRHEENYFATTGGAFNWIYTAAECPVLPSVNDQSVYCPPVTSPSIQALINKDGTQVPSQPCGIGWERIFHVKSCADSSSTVLPEGVTPSSSSENTGSTVIQKTSPDICVAGAVPSQLHNSHSSGNLLVNAHDDNLAKSHSCHDLKSNLFSEDNNNKIKGPACIATAKSLPDNSRENCWPRAFRSQLRVQLSKPSLEKMAPIDCTLCQSPIDSRQRRLMRQLKMDEYQATSFEHPNPQNLTLPDKKIYRDVGYFPVWPDAPPPPPRVDTQTQTLNSSPTPSLSSEQDAKRKDDTKSASKSTLEKKSKKACKKSERISTSSGETQQKKSKHSRNSELSKRRTSSRSQSATACIDSESKHFRDSTIAGGIEAEKDFRKNSIASEKLPWCACWGNGCI